MSVRKHLPEVFYFIRGRQGIFFKNLATMVIPFFVIPKSSVDKTISRTVLPHFYKDTVA